MNYEQYIKHTYQLDIEHTDTNGCYLMLANGDVHYVVDTNTHLYNMPDYYNVVNYFANYGNRVYNSSVNMMLYYSEEDNVYFLITRDVVDYVIFHSFTSNYDIDLACLHEDNGHYFLVDGNSVNGYMQYNALDTFESFIYGGQHIDELTDGDKVITDFSNIAPFNNGTEHYPTYNEYRYVVRGENVTYNQYYHVITPRSMTNIRLSYGSPLQEIRNQEYERGYTAGYNTGRVDGQREGYAQGVASGGVDSNTHNALGYIQQAFGVVDNIMQLQVLPNITLGLVFSIPMTLVAIMVIFRIIKK